jgi:hypothetical protein
VPSSGFSATSLLVSESGQGKDAGSWTYSARCHGKRRLQDDLGGTATAWKFLAITVG